jgi:hypothetical protein
MTIGKKAGHVSRLFHFATIRKTDPFGTVPRVACKAIRIRGVPSFLQRFSRNPGKNGWTAFLQKACTSFNYFPVAGNCGGKGTDGGANRDELNLP